MVTVLFNVSAIKIVQGLRDQPELAKAFNSAAPGLAALVLDSSQNALAALSDSEESLQRSAKLNLLEGSPDDVIPIALSSGERATGFTKRDAQALLFFYECRRNLMVLPVGWPWMAELVDHLAVRATEVTNRIADIDVDPNETGAARQARTCAQRLSDVAFSPEAAEQMQLLGFNRVAPADEEEPEEAAPVEEAAPAATPTAPAEAAPAPAPALAESLTPPPIEAAGTDTKGVKFTVSASEFMPQFGPNFRTDPWYAILIGWLITTFAAAQGAPFWFDLLRKLIDRRPA
jgi:hypothetical protein